MYQSKLRKSEKYRRTIIVKEYGTMRAAQAFCTRNEETVRKRWDNMVHFGCNEVDAGCVQVELIGLFFAQEIYLADLK